MHMMTPKEDIKWLKVDETRINISALDSKSSRNGGAGRHWTNRIDFIISCLACAVGLGNIWRFPYLCYKNGGGSFIIPYMVCLIFGGVPVLFLEVFVGQYMQKASYKAWDICPAFRGIGIASNTVLFINNVYYNVIVAWALYYLFMSFGSVLPWAHCNNSWNTPRCAISLKETLYWNQSDVFTKNKTSDPTATLNITFNADPAVEFWERKVLHISSGIDFPGNLVWELVLALLVAWLVCYFSIWKGINYNMKVVYITVLMPYLLLTSLMVRGVTLPGATEGLRFFMEPDFARLLDAQVWLDAGTQILFTLSVAVGAIIVMGSYNKFKHNSYRDVFIIVGVNSITSMLGGVVIFSVLGFMAKEQNIPVQEVAESGPGLVFIVYAKAVALMPAAPLWAVLFCTTLIMLGLDTQFVCLEGFITNFVDAFPVLQQGWNREIYTAVYCVINFFLALPMVSYAGIYAFQLLDYYGAASVGLLWICLWECIAIGWVFGGQRMYDKIEVMLGFRINPWLRVCWMFITPTIMTAIGIFTWINFKLLKYNRTYEYPWWAHAIGLVMTVSYMTSIPGYLIVILLRTSGSLRERWNIITKPIPQNHQMRELPEETEALSSEANVNEATV